MCVGVCLWVYACLHVSVDMYLSASSGMHVEMCYMCVYLSICVHRCGWKMYVLLESFCICVQVHLFTCVPKHMYALCVYVTIQSQSFLFLSSCSQ